MKDDEGRFCVVILHRGEKQPSVNVIHMENGAPTSSHTAMI